ncbi:NAD(P)-binding protein [Streptomyces sp. CA-251387]|uniref:NAD(P)-binding protein n=1 Tax=Streptomyces sp. CA-251387 TaxID=3240064 RepID=UPI003D91F9A7
MPAPLRRRLLAGNEPFQVERPGTSAVRPDLLRSLWGVTRSVGELKNLNDSLSYELARRMPTRLIARLPGKATTRLDDHRGDQHTEERSMKVGMLGGGIGGLTAALCFARRGHHVLLIDADQSAAKETDLLADQWQRPGIPQFHQPHTFLAASRRELRDHTPDVLQMLMEAGAEEVDQAARTAAARR